MTVVSGNIRFMRIFAEVPQRRGVKRQWGNRKHRFSEFSDTTSLVPQKMRTTLLYSIISSHVAFPMTPKYPPEWPFYVKFLLLRRAVSEFILYTYCRTYLQNIFVVSRHQQRCAEADRDPQNICDQGKTVDLPQTKSCGRYIVGTRNLNK